MRKPNRPSHSLRNASAFTVIELLVVVAVVGVLAVLLFVTAGMMLQKNRATRCMSNLQQINVASAAYSADNGGQWPRNNVSDPRYYFFQELYPYLNMNIQDHTENMKTVFVCPADRKGTNEKDDIYKVSKRPLSYAQNGYLDYGDAPVDAYSAGKRRGFVQFPSELMLYMEFEAHWLVSTSSMNKDSQDKLEALNFRHNGWINAAYADGHVAPMEVMKIWGKGGDAKNPFPFFQGRR